MSSGRKDRRGREGRGKDRCLVLRAEIMKYAVERLGVAESGQSIATHEVCVKKLLNRC